MSTKTLCRTLSAVATALDAYTHLPDLDFVSTWVNPATAVLLGFPFARTTQAELSRLCEWAQALDCPIRIELSYGGSGTASVSFDLAGYQAQINVNLHSGHAYELGAALRMPITPAEPVLTVTPSALQDALAAAGPGAVM